MQIELNWIGFDWIYFYSIDATNYYLENMQIELNWIDFVWFAFDQIQFHWVSWIGFIELWCNMFLFNLIGGYLRIVMDFCWNFREFRWNFQDLYWNLLIFDDFFRILVEIFRNFRIFEDFRFNFHEFQDYWWNFPQGSLWIFKIFRIFEDLCWNFHEFSGFSTIFSGFFRIFQISDYFC